MSIEQKPLSDLSEKDLLQLIDNQVAERKTIEYKRERVGKSANDRKEFLYDVSSFANAYRIRDGREGGCSFRAYWLAQD